MTLIYRIRIGDLDRWREGAPFCDPNAWIFPALSIEFISILNINLNGDHDPPYSRCGRFGDNLPPGVSAQGVHLPKRGVNITKKKSA